jgi:hypothetical protein
VVSFLLVLEYRILKEKIVFELEKKYCRQINSRGNGACQLTSRPTPVCQQQGWQTISFPRNIYYPFLLILKPDGSKVHNVSWTWTKKARQIVPGSLSSIMPCRTTIAYVLTTELTTMSIAPSWCAVTTVGQRRAIIVNQQKKVWHTVLSTLRWRQRQYIGVLLFFDVTYILVPLTLDIVQKNTCLLDQIVWGTRTYP